MNLLELRGIGTRFGHRWVHEGIDLDVSQRELMALVGGSGEGKTTLLRHMAGLSRPTRGEVRIFGEHYLDGGRRARRLRRNRVGMLFQHGALYSALSVYDNIAFPMRELHCLQEDEIRTMVFSRMALVELEPHVAGFLPAQLSGGMVKRVALARALALEPELLLLDEPTAGLDPDRSRGFVDLIRSLHASLGTTMVFVTHDVDTLLALASKVAVLADRRILALDTPEEIMILDHPFVDSFFRTHIERDVGMTPWMR